MEASDQEYTDYDISSLFGKRIVATGYWSDNDGLDLYETWVESKTLQHIPEDVKIIPAHTKEMKDNLEKYWKKVGKGKVSTSY